MSGRHSFEKLRGTLSPEQRAESERLFVAMVEAMPLSQLRRARELTQVQLASILKIDQPAVAKMEKRTDTYVSTLRSYVEAMGGELRIQAIFPDGAVNISQFDDQIARA
jgi:predicted transcriptional regulator